MEAAVVEEPALIREEAVAEPPASPYGPGDKRAGRKTGLPAAAGLRASPPASAPHFQFSHCTKRLFKHEPAVPHRRSGAHARRAGHVELAGSERRRNETRETKYDGVLTMCLISWLEMNGAIVRGQRFPEKVSFKYWSVVSLLVKMNFIAPK